MDGEARWAIVHGVTKKVRQDLATKTTRTLHLVCGGKIYYSSAYLAYWKEMF